MLSLCVCAQLSDEAVLFASLLLLEGGVLLDQLPFASLFEGGSGAQLVHGRRVGALLLLLHLLDSRQSLLLV